MPSAFGANLTKWRRYLRLNQAAVGKFLGVTRQTVASWEAGTKVPDLKQMIGLCNLYRRTMDEMIGATSPTTGRKVGPDA